MGGADIIPGVSGGTVALVVGIYEPLIGSIYALATAAVRLLRGDADGARERLAQVHWRLVIPLGLGIVTALGIGAIVIERLLERYPVQSSALFFGLIAGSLAIPWARIERRTSREVAIAAGAALVAFVLVGLPPATVADPSLLFVFLAAAVAICAMILPGVSGAFLLLVFGIYQATLAAVRSLDIAYVAVFVAGAVLGLGAFAKLLSYLLRRHHATTMAALVGLMAGSLRALWPWLTEDRGFLPPPANMPEVLGALALALLGLAAITLLGRIGLASERRLLARDTAPDS